MRIGHIKEDKRAQYRQSVRNGTRTEALTSMLLPLGIGLVAVFINALVEDKHVSFILDVTTVLSVCISADRGFLLLPRQTLCLRVISIHNIVQLGAMLLLALLGVAPIVTAAQHAPDLRDFGGDAVYPYIIPSVIAVVLAYCLSAIGTKKTTRASQFQHNETFGGDLLVASCASLLFGGLISNFLPTAVAYFLRVLSPVAPFIAIFAGYCATRSRTVLWAWLPGLTMAFILYSMLGGRYLAFFPAAMFTVGLYIGSSTTRRAQILPLLFCAAVPGLLILGMIGILRGEVGRDNVRELSLNRLVEIVRLAGQIGRDPDSAVMDELLSNSLGRLVAWPTPVVTSHSPDPMPYRGYGGLRGEVRAATNIHGIVGGFDIYEKAELGSLPARNYGFSVNESTSVEFGILADGWSRGGLGGAVAFCIIFVFIIGVTERLVSTLPLSSAGRMLLLAVCMLSAVNFTNLPLVSALRAHLLQFLGWMALVFVVRAFVSSPNGASRARRRRINP